LTNVRLIIFGFIGFALSGCMTTSSGTTEPGPSLLGDPIKEIELFPMGNNRYSLFVRGNNFVSNSDVKKRWYEEVEAVCLDGYTVEDVGIKKVTMSGLLKPAVEGTFSCN